MVQRSPMSLGEEKDSHNYDGLKNTAAEKD